MSYLQDFISPVQDLLHFPQTLLLLHIPVLQGNINQAEKKCNFVISLQIKILPTNTCDIHIITSCNVADYHKVHKGWTAQSAAFRCFQPFVVVCFSVVVVVDWSMTITLHVSQNYALKCFKCSQVINVHCIFFARVKAMLTLKSKHILVLFNTLWFRHYSLTCSCVNINSGWPMLTNVS